MPAEPPRPADVLTALQRADATRPRLTVYDDTPGPSAGERVELSARVLTNWVAKAANALQEEGDVEPGSVVRLDLPPHWRTVYWAYAVWSVGACVALDDGPADVLVTADPAAAETFAGLAVLVTLPALARSAAVPVPTGVFDEARELATFGDLFAPYAAPGDDDPALRAGGAVTAYESIVPGPAGAPGCRVHVDAPTDADDPRAFLELTLATWVVGGSVVLSRGPLDASRRAARLAAEGVTVDAGSPGSAG